MDVGMPWFFQWQLDVQCLAAKMAVWGRCLPKGRRPKSRGCQCVSASGCSHRGYVPAVRFGQRGCAGCISSETSATPCPAFSLILIAPVAGHAFSPFRGFRGGKAITVSFGVLLGASRVFPGVWVLAAWYLFFSLIVRICPNSVRTCVTYLFFACTAFLWPVCHPFFAGCWGIAAIVYLKHIREAKASQGSLSFFHRSFTWESRSDSHH